jgi:hypothetical protein
MKLEEGLKFKKCYGDDKNERTEYCEIRGIIDNNIIVLLCQKENADLHEEKEFYMTIDKKEFKKNVKSEIYSPIQTT